MEKILVIDDDKLVRKVFKLTLSKEGYEVLEAEDGKQGLQLIKAEKPDLVLTDFQMPGVNGLEVIAEITRLRLNIPVIMLTGYGDVSLTIKSIQRGAYEFLEKPTKPDVLKSTVRKALDSAQISRSLPDIIFTEEDVDKEIDNNFLVGRTPKMKEIFKNVGMISLNKVNVLIEGESGTGKEQIARLIHYSGITRDKPLVVVNCSALSEALLESELFGHVKDSFADSVRDKKGKFELAGDGTILLDEISEVSLNTQVKLLRVIQEMEFERVGGELPIPMNARIIASSNKNLEELIKVGKFREDLYYRLKVFTIKLPPLRERKDDISDLVVHFLNKFNHQFNKNVTKIEDGVIEMLMMHSWHGNLRELENTILQAIVMSKNDVLDKKSITLNNSFVIQEADITADYEYKSLADMENKHIKAILDSVHWNKVEASRILEITRPTLNAKIEKYSLKQ